MYPAKNFYEYFGFIVAKFEYENISEIYCKFERRVVQDCVKHSEFRYNYPKSQSILSRQKISLRVTAVSVN
jgi:hypothetical protein